MNSSHRCFATFLWRSKLALSSPDPCSMFLWLCLAFLVHFPNRCDSSSSATVTSKSTSSICRFDHMCTSLLSQPHVSHHGYSSVCFVAHVTGSTFRCNHRLRVKSTHPCPLLSPNATRNITDESLPPVQSHGTSPSAHPCLLMTSQANALYTFAFVRSGEPHVF